MRAVVVLLWVVAVAMVLLPLLRRWLGQARRRRRVATSDELVKDPVCQTYVVRSRAVERTHHGEPVYFCSAQCANRWG